MLQEISVKAYAKINFGLKVLPKRDDGFHCIESIFQTVDLYDELIVNETQTKGCEVICDSMELPKINTISNAYQAFCDITGRNEIGISVKLIKGIPSGGGLGGGSSDAAALVRVLEKLYGIVLTDEQLDYIASKTGSDVFFFMHCDSEGKGAALVSGRGEIVKKIIPRNDLFLLLIFPDVHSSTKEAYSLVDKMFNLGREVKSPDFKDYENIYSLEPNKWTFSNTFTPVITEVYKKVGDALRELKKSGCDYAEMSGSGSTVFGVYTLKQQAMFVNNLLTDAWKCKLVQTV